MITPRNGDLTEVIEGRAIFMHVAAHDHRDLAIGPHGSVRNFPVAHVTGLYAASPVLGKRRRCADHESQVDDTGINRSRHPAKQRHSARATRGAAEKKTWGDAKNLGDFFGPERLRVRRWNRYAQALALEVLQS